MRPRKLALGLAALMIVPLVGSITQIADAVPNPVATTEETYQAFGRVFPDPHGCLAYGAPDTDGDGVKDTPHGISPWAKGRVCADQYLQYEEVLNGANFLSRRFADLFEVIRVPGRSAGLARTISFEGGKAQVMGRDTRPLYMFRITNERSRVPERKRKHFVYSLSIHGIERAGLEGGARAMEDLVTWAACERAKYRDTTPACSDEGPFPKKIVETPASYDVPTAGQVLNNAAVYFIMPNPDGWARGQVAPVEVENNQPNASYQPGFFFQRYNGNGVDVNRDWPTKGYTFKPYSPGSEPETRAFGSALKDIAAETSPGKFTAGIDLHGMITAYAFSYTLIGAGQRDYRKNELTVDTTVRTFVDQTRRMSWSPYIADRNANGVQDPGEECAVDPVWDASTRGRIPACVADQWGTVIDTIGYQISGGIGDWFDSEIGLDAVGIDNEMYASHLAPNTVFEPALEQTHIDGNKGLIYSQIASMFADDGVRFRPKGDVGYVFDPRRLRKAAGDRITHPKLPQQQGINVILPCQDRDHSNPTGCGGGRYGVADGSPVYEFDVMGPKSGYWNGGLYVRVTRPNVLGVGDGHIDGDDDLSAHIQLQHFHEGQWHTVTQDFNQSPLYGQAGQTLTINDPEPGRWRVWFEHPHQVPARLQVGFRKWSGEAGATQAAIDASSMDFFKELNRYVPKAKDLEAFGIREILRSRGALRGLDTLIVVNKLGDRGYLRKRLDLSRREVGRYFNALERFARGGGNLVLTDAALQTAAEIGLVGDKAVAGSRTMAGSYHFAVDDDTVTYRDPKAYPLTKGMNKPGAAELVLGRRQAAEPSPLGYTPDPDMDPDPQMPFWGVDPDAWTRNCGLARCITALSDEIKNKQYVGYGEARLGKGRVRIAGVLFPNPVFAPDEANDHRFGLASYALTYTGYDVFKNLIRYER